MKLPPSYVSADHESLKQSGKFIMSRKGKIYVRNNYIKITFVASQTCCFLRLLPMIVGDLITRDDPYWNNFHVLLTITDYVLAPKSTIGIARYLQELICKHHTQFKQLYPDRSITPKFHHMVHLPQWIVKYVYLVNEH